MTTRSSGDLAADRRFGYGEGCLADGDAAAAADLFRQTLELVPDWSPAWFALGDALDRAGKAADAIAAFRRSLELEPGDDLGAGVRLARLGALAPATAMSPAYVATLFDQYAGRFDEHLVKALDYRGPQIILDALEAVCRAQRRPCFFSSAIDLGCGTGLMAKALAGRAGTIDGCDLAPAMVEAARRTGLYRTVEVKDAVVALDSAGTADLVVAADVLVYVGDFSPLFHAAARRLDPPGLLAFTVQSRDGDGYGLGDDLRFHHSEAYIRATADAAGLNVLHLARCVTRLDAGSPVEGLVVVVERAEKRRDD